MLKATEMAVSWTAAVPFGLGSVGSPLTSGRATGQYGGGGALTGLGRGVRGRWGVETAAQTAFWRV